MNRVCIFNVLNTCVSMTDNRLSCSTNDNINQEYVAVVLHESHNWV